ncbi:glycosyl hydrolase family 28-related protein [Niallia sp. 03190]|uniref:glycosyl hydrolase family 28-related protein n=1 Tax=Niallia sp. 03190 TaxID=3458061 RepID=UPI00404481E7
MARWPYGPIGVATTRAFRNLINKIFGDIEADMKEQKARVDNLLQNSEQASEVVDSRVDANGDTHAILKDRLDSDYTDVTSQLANKAQQTDLDLTNANLLTHGINALYPPVPLVGAKGDGVTDDTSTIQALINFIELNRYSTLYCPGSLYLINGALVVKSQITIKGEHISNGFNDPNRLNQGTIFKGGGGSTNPVLTMDYSTNGTSGRFPFLLQDILFLGSDNWNTMNNAVDRAAFEVKQTMSYFVMERVYVSGFKRQGFKFNQAFDGTINDCRLLSCGTDGIYAALDLMTDFGDSTNNLRFNNLQIEQCPFYMKLDYASVITFTSCKFEMSNMKSLQSYFKILSTCNHIKFLACHFQGQDVERYIHELNLYSDISQMPYIIDNKGLYTTFSECDFVSTKGQTHRSGGKWIDSALSSRLTIADCNFDALCGDAYSLTFGNYAKIHDNNFNIPKPTSVSGAKNGFYFNGTNSIFHHNTITGDVLPVTSGVMFFLFGENNSVHYNDYAKSSYNSLFNGPRLPKGTSVKFLLKEPFILPTDTPQEIDVTGRDIIISVNETEGRKISSLINGYKGQQVVIMVGGGSKATTIQNSTGETGISLDGNQDRIMYIGQTLTLVNTGGLLNCLWKEIARTPVNPPS